MRLLLDECMPAPLRRELVGHEVSTVIREGLGGLRNGKLLAAAQNKWDVLLTTDKQIPEEQALRNFAIGVLIVRVINNRLEDVAAVGSGNLAHAPVRKGWRCHQDWRPEAACAGSVNEASGGRDLHETPDSTSVDVQISNSIFIRA